MQSTETVLSSYSVPIGSSHFLLDIETTGLHKTQDQIIAIGVIFKEASLGLCCKQWFSETPEEEKELLLAFLNWSNSYTSVYTYNGNSFDLSFLMARFKTYGLQTDFLTTHTCVDMKKVLKKCASQRSTLENLFHYQREGTLSGKELISLYLAYTHSKDSIYQTLILGHNQDELCSLLIFYEVYQTLTHLSEKSCIAQKNEAGTLILELKNKVPNQTSVELDWVLGKIIWHKGESSLFLYFPLVSKTLKNYLTPAKDYYFIPSQNQLMHKSLALFIPKELKQKVSQKECYLMKESLFIKLYTTYKVGMPIFEDDEKNSFIEYAEQTDYSLLLPYQAFSYFVQSSRN